MSIPSIIAKREKEFDQAFPKGNAPLPLTTARFLEWQELRDKDIKSHISATLKEVLREICKEVNNEKVIEAIFPNQSQERLQMKAWLNEKLDKISTSLQTTLSNLEGK